MIRPEQLVSTLKMDRACLDVQQAAGHQLGHAMVGVIRWILVPGILGGRVCLGRHAFKEVDQHDPTLFEREGRQLERGMSSDEKARCYWTFCSFGPGL